MINRDDSHRVRVFSEPQKPLGNDAGRKIGGEIDDRFGAKLGQRSSRRRQISSKSGVERVLSLEEERECPLRRVRPQTTLEQGGRVITDGLCSAQHPLSRLLADPVARIEHAIDSGDADAGGVGEIADGRAIQTLGLRVGGDCKAGGFDVDGF